MSSPPPVELFKGTNWEECHKFILAIRARALWEGKQRDSAWIADFAAPLFWRKALSWHCRLPEEVRQDWSKLEIALIDRWPEPEDDDEPQIQPTPAAAPSLIRDDKVGRPLQGALKIVPHGSTTNYDLKFAGGWFVPTSDAKEAARVRCISMFSTTLLERIDDPSSSLLAIHWSESTPDIEKDYSGYAAISCIKLCAVKSSWGYKGPLQLMSCTVSSDNEVTPVWKKNDNSQITLSPFVAISGYLFLAADAEAYARKYNGQERAKFFLERIDETR